MVKNRIKNTIIISYSIVFLLIGISLTYFGIRYIDNYGYDISHITSFNVKTPNITTQIFLKQPIVDTLKILWVSHPDKEFALCLDGKYYSDEDIIIINEIQPVEIRQSNSTYTLHVICDDNALIDLHIHPNGVCGLSDLDKNATINNKEIKYWSVMCGEKNIAIYHQDDLNNRLKIEVIE